MFEELSVSEESELWCLYIDIDNRDESYCETLKLNHNSYDTPTCIITGGEFVHSDIIKSFLESIAMLNPSNNVCVLTDLVLQFRFWIHNRSRFISKRTKRHSRFNIIWWSGAAMQKKKKTFYWVNSRNRFSHFEPSQYCIQTGETSPTNQPFQMSWFLSKSLRTCQFGRISVVVLGVLRFQRQIPPPLLIRIHSAFCITFLLSSLSLNCLRCIFQFVQLIH